MFAPVVFLATGACFATTKDVVQLQKDINTARLSEEQRVARLEQQITRLEQQQSTRFDSLARLLRSSTDSLRSFESRFFATGGNIADNTSGLQRLVNQMIARFDALLTEQENQGKELKLINEQVRGFRAALAVDSMKTNPVEGPLERLASAERQIDRSPSTARELAEGVVAINPDSATMARAYNLIAETFRKEDRQVEQDSVFRIVFERFPNSPEAPNAMYLVALALETVHKKLPEARALYKKVVDTYPNAPGTAALADAGYRRIPPH